MPNHAEQLAQELNLNVKNVQGAIELIDQGNTIPFIARYRKEATGSMDDQVLRDLGDRLEYLRGLDKRKDEVTSSITEQGAMTPELTAALSKAKTLAEVEDIYRPYKPKRKTRASIAKARGLQPLATAIFRQDAAFDPERAAADYLNDEVPDAAAARQAASSETASAIISCAPCNASSGVFTSFSSDTYFAASLSTGSVASWRRIYSARGSRPFSFAILARVFLLGR